MAIVDIRSLPAIPWKNGGGVTRNLAIWPEGAGFDDFIWRVSIADVESSGDFSIFPGVDRTILLLEGGGMLLQGKAGPPHSLTTPFLPYSLRGEDPVRAQLVNGWSRDFNSMVRRDAARASIEVWDREGERVEDSAVAVFFCGRGVFLVWSDEGEPVLLPAGHALTLNSVGADLRVRPESRGSVLIGAFLELPVRTRAER